LKTADYYLPDLRSCKLNEIIKHKSGGQPGNQNARKHGFYSKALTQAEKIKMKDALALDGLDLEIAVLRVKFRSLLTQNGQNLQLINHAVDTLGRLYNIKFRLGRNDSNKLKEAVSSALEEFIISGPTAPDNDESP
jgi:hypothetical protein